MALISKTTIQEVNDRLDAIAVVEDYIRLEKKSGRWWGRCPFHAGGQEKTPSFKVDPDVKMFHCFGCNKGGSIISFVMEMDKLSYPETIKHLAKKFNIEIIYEDGGYNEEDHDSTLKEQLYELYRRTTITFQHFLLEKTEGQNALHYLSSRGFTGEMIEKFKLGFSPSNRDFLHNFLVSKGYSAEFLEKSGLFSSRYTTSPMFSGRLMFPIADRNSKVVAFGGRAMPGVRQNDGSEPPKYINSPETEIYKKGQTLYALDIALPKIRQEKTVYIAEGYMDVIALHQAGVSNAVAPLGTAFTDEQANLLRRWAEKVILIFDTDEAGEKAAYKAIVTCRKNGITCALVNMSAALKDEAFEQNIDKLKDPADILQKFGGEILNKVLKCTINDFEYLISRSMFQYKAGKCGKNHAAEFMFPFLESLASEVEREDCIAQIADAFLLEKNAVKEDYSKRKKSYAARQEVDSRQSNSAALNIRMNAEIRLLTVVAVNMSLYPEFRSALEIKEIDDAAAKELFVAMEECFLHDEAGIDALLARIKSGPLKDFISSRGSSPEFKCEPRRQMEEGINKVVVRKRLKKRLMEISAQIRESERNTGNAFNGDALNDTALNIDELLAEKKNIDSQIRKLEGR